jgi:hypothetical protein
MTGDEVRQVLEAMLPQEEIDRLCQQFGVIERQRKLHLGMFVRAMVISSGAPGDAYQADVLRSYLECEVPPVARSAFYRWFDKPLERFMAALADRALAYARAQQVDLSGPLCGVTDWYAARAAGRYCRHLTPSHQTAESAKARSRPLSPDHPTERLVGDSPARGPLRMQIRHLATFDAVGTLPPGKK